MKTIKTVGITLLVLIAVLVVIGFFLPSKVHVERHATIKAPVDVVFNQVSTLKNWESWSPWHKLDPNMKITYSGTTSGKGAAYSWESDHKNVGCGTMTITNATDLSSLETEMVFKGQGSGTGGFKFNAKPEGTEVSWYVDFDMGMNPIARYMGLFMDGMLGKDLEAGLVNLDKASLAAQNSPSEIPNN